MKELEKLTVHLIQEDRDLLKSAIEANKPKPTPTQKHEHWKAEEVQKLLENKDCPECKAEAKKLERNIAKTFRDSRKTLPFVCEECGLGVEENEEECPECGNKQARER